MREQSTKDANMHIRNTPQPSPTKSKNINIKLFTPTKLQPCPIGPAFPRSPHSTISKRAQLEKYVELVRSPKRNGGCGGGSKRKDPWEAEFVFNHVFKDKTLGETELFVFLVVKTWEMPCFEML